MRHTCVARAKEMMFSGGMIAAEEAERIGLVNRVGESAAHDAFVEDFCAGVGQCSRFAVAAWAYCPCAKSVLA